ncbi:hypothetical protein WDZ92_03445, partial [Nostoc sp. NIES-2111]
SFTGLCFTGFGLQQFFPSIESIVIYGYLQGSLLWYCDAGRTFEISYDMSGGVATFAQDDIIRTILTGVAPDFESSFVDETLKILNFQHDSLKNDLLDAPQLSEETKSHILSCFSRNNPVDIHNEWHKRLLKVKEEAYVHPAVNTISLLPKQDLADLAESWLHLTYLDRRMSNKPESVGGDVDVMLITKGDGIIWVKRKHYFRPELNQHFFRSKNGK